MWRIAIPSYKRATRLRDATLTVLKKHNISKELIDVFVADEAERETYAATLDPATYNELIIAVPGMGAVRNFMTDYYADGDRILFIDDDIYDFLTLEPLDLQAFIDKAFADCAAAGLRLWGIYPVANKFFMKPGYTTDLRYVIGSMYGVMNDRDIKVSMDDGEDKERTCLYYLKYGGVLRYSDVSPKTKYYREPGGMQTTRTLERQQKSGLALLEQFPMLLTRKDKKDGKIEHRFRDRRKNKKPE
jgi:hypothetical protein